MQNNISVIFGKKGSGKTTLARELIKKSNSNSIVIWDYLGDYSGMGEIFKNRGDFINSFTREKKIYILQNFEENQFNDIAKIVYDIGKIFFVVEEVDLICNPHFITGDFSKMIRYGRHFLIDMLFISRRPQEVNRLVTSQADNCYVFKFIEPRDKIFLKDWAGITSEELETLKQYNFIYKDL